MSPTSCSFFTASAKVVWSSTLAEPLTGRTRIERAWEVSAVSGLMVFLLSLLVPIYTITGYDASAHTSEETHKAALSAPRGMVSAVWWSSVFGYVMLIGFLFLIPDMKDAAKQGWNVFFWAIDLRFPVWLKNVLYVGIFVSQFLCGLATVT